MNGIDVSDVKLDPGEEGAILAYELEKKRLNAGASRYLRACQKKVKRKKYDAERTKQDAILIMQNAVSIRRGNGALYEVDQWNESQLEALSLYFSGDERFEAMSPSFSLKKGILLHGNPGCGKTLMMKAFQNNSYQSYKLYDIAEMADQVIDESSRAEVTNRLSKVIKGPPNRFGHEKYGICIDDAGFEVDRKLYGNPVELLLAVIRKRYSKNISGRYTHMVTNLTVGELKDRYGERFASRISEMFNQITFHPNAPDRRKLFNNQKQN